MNSKTTYQVLVLRITAIFLLAILVAPMVDSYLSLDSDSSVSLFESESESEKESSDKDDVEEEIDQRYVEEFLLSDQMHLHNFLCRNKNIGQFQYRIYNSAGPEILVPPPESKLV